MSKTLCGTIEQENELLTVVVAVVQFVGFLWVKVVSKCLSSATMSAAVSSSLAWKRATANCCRWHFQIYF